MNNLGQFLFFRSIFKREEKDFEEQRKRKETLWRKHVSKWENNFSTLKRAEVSTKDGERLLERANTARRSFGG